MNKASRVGVVETRVAEDQAHVRGEIGRFLVMADGGRWGGGREARATRVRRKEQLIDAELVKPYYTSEVNVVGQVLYIPGI